MSVRLTPWAVRSMLDLSLSYMDEECLDNLDRELCDDLWIIRFEFGFLVHVTDEEEFEAPEPLKRLIQFCKSQGIGWIKLDQDGPSHEGLQDYLYPTPLTTIAGRMEQGR